MKKTALLLSVMLLLSVCLCGCGETAYTPTLFTANGERWSIGFSSVEIEVPENPHTPLYIAGYMSGEEFSDILDRQCANAVWLGCQNTDGTDAGGMLLIGVDCVGLGSDTVDRIRDGLSEFASEVNCSAIAVYATHTHAGIDTLGLWGPYAQEGKNTEFVNNVITAAVAAGKAAYEDRSAGALYYGQTEAENLQYDSRYPLVYDENMHQLRFEPDDGAYNGIRLVFFAAHAEALRGDNLYISRDFPGIMADEIKKECGDDMLFIPGAIGGLIMTPEILDKSLDDGSPQYHVDNCRLTGELLSRMILLSINDYTETEVPPMLSYAECDFNIPLDNTAFLLYKFLGILGNESGRGSDSETGYYLTSRCAAIRFGDSITAAMLPGEIFPELVYEDTDFAKAAPGYVLTEETFPSLSRLAAQYDCGTLLIGGLCNDEIGYILPPRDFLVHPKLPYLEKIEDESGENHYEETNSAGIRTAQVLFAAMEKVFAALSATK